MKALLKSPPTQLLERLPDHPFLIQPQSNLLRGKGATEEDKETLSHYKVNSIECVEKYVALCEKHAELNDIDVSMLLYRITPKLDGISSSISKNDHLFSNQEYEALGHNLSLLIDKGLHIIGNSDESTLTGAVVVLKEYFERNISSTLKSSRKYLDNMVNDIVFNKETNETTVVALNAKAIHFVAFDSVEGITVDRDSLIHSIEHITRDMKVSSPYHTAGTVIEVANDQLKEVLSHDGTKYTLVFET